MSDMQRRMASIRDAATYCGLSRVTIYKLGTEHEGLLRKYRGKTLVELRVLDQLLDALPYAKVRLRVRTHASKVNRSEQK